MSQKVFTFTCSTFSAPDCHNQPWWWRDRFDPNCGCCCYVFVPGRDTVSDGAARAGTVSAVGGALQTPVGATLRIVIF